MSRWFGTANSPRHKKERAPDLPARWSAWQRRKNTCLYRLILVVVAVLRRVPRALFTPTSFVLGRVACALFVRERVRAQQNLMLAGVATTRGEARHIAAAMFVHLARSALEFGQASRLLAHHGTIAGGAEARAVLDEALQQGRGLIAVTGHIGNWELMAQQIAAWGYPAHAIAKPLYDPRLSALIDKERSKAGLVTLWRGDRDASRRMLQVFREGGVLCLLIDQDTRVPGAFVPFFGRPAHTPTAPAILALRRQIPLVVGWMHRQGGRHMLRAKRIDTSGRRFCPADVAEVTRTLSYVLEGAIRSDPAQWVWMHRRWNQQISPE